VRKAKPDAPHGRGPMSQLFRLTLALVRGWTRLYTWRMPSAQREMRRAEIDSDLWEFQQDGRVAGDVAAALHVLARMLIGVPHDLSWRVEHSAAAPGRSLTALTLAAAALVTAATLIFETIRTPVLPRAPAAPMSGAFLLPAPQPPPPPPPPPGESYDRDYWSSARTR
jgi:hypothetical protein